MIFSYIDPGTGSLLASAVVGLSLALVFSLRGLFYRLLAVLTGKKNAVGSDFSGKLVFFSEGKNYWPVFQPILQELLARRQAFVYLSADRNDPGLSWLSEQHHQQTATDTPSSTDCPQNALAAYAQAIYLGKLSSAIYAMNRLRAKVCVLTTPQLGVMQLRRSPHVRHYCHVMHSPSDVHTYEKFAFDHFDSVLCSSPQIMANLQYLQRKRETEYMRRKGLVQKQQLLATGCPYYQYYLSQTDATIAPPAADSATSFMPNSSAPCILLASSWGERSFLGHLEGILEPLLPSYRIIFRPHPQAWVSNKEQLEEAERRYGKRIQIDRAVDNRPSLQAADLLICDISGIIYDFAFLYRKPVLALYPQQAQAPGYEDADLEMRDSAFDLLEDVGAALPLEHLEQLEQTAAQLLGKEVGREQIGAHIFCLKDAGRQAAEQIGEICKTYEVCEPCETCEVCEVFSAADTADQV